MSKNGHKCWHCHNRMTDTGTLQWVPRSYGKVLKWFCNHTCHKTWDDARRAKMGLRSRIKAKEKE